MSRVIKFRAWDREYGQMLSWEYLKEHRTLAGLNESVMQFTGLLDKNGKEIYEGDILEGSTNGLIFGHQLKFTVIWDIKSAGFWLHFENPKLREYISWANKLEVIGNIYENPELTENK